VRPAIDPVISAANTQSDVTFSPGRTEELPLLSGMEIATFVKQAVLDAMAGRIQ